MATQLFGMRSIVSGRRIATIQWPIESQDSECRVFLEVGRRNITRARARLGVEQARGHTGEGETIRDPDGNIISGPPDGEMIPPVSHETLLARPSVPILAPTRNKEREEDLEGRRPNSDTPKRVGAPLDESDPEMAKSGDAADSKLEDRAFTLRREIGLPDFKVTVAASQENLRRAGREPNRGWPAYELIRPTGDPSIVARDPIFISKNYWNVDEDHGWVTGTPIDPLARAFTLAGAVRAAAEDLRTLGANTGLLRPLVGRDFRVWALTGRKA